MRVLTKKVGEKWKIAEIENSLEALQKYVGGNIEVVWMHRGNVIICNEEGLINGSHFNCRLEEVQFFGDILVCGADGEEFCDIPKHCKSCQNCYPDCPCNTCENDSAERALLMDEDYPCCQHRGHRKSCKCGTCPDYKKESPAEAERKEK